MRRSICNDGWTVRPKTNHFAERLGTGPEPQPVTLPHDAMIATPRTPEAGPANAYFPGGCWEYRTTLAAPADQAGTAVFLEFEGVYRDAMVWVNGTLAGRRPGGYSDFYVQVDHLLRSGADNEVRVEARAHDDSRWYSGAGIYRNVWLWQGSRVHFVPGRLEVLTPEIDDEVAIVEVAAFVRNQSPAVPEVFVRVELVDPSGTVVASSEAPVTTRPGEEVTARQRLHVPGPRRWSLDHPQLYRCRVTLLAGDVVLDEDSTTFGIRSLALDPSRGLRLNGQPVLLRGACVHHDNGPLGSAAIDRAEERRVELLKAAGFNAIRSAHNPMSKAMLDACDRLGVLVMDEAFDMWAQPKSEHDYALRFPDWWEEDIESMVRKDVNHPSVVLYSIGNEIPEAGIPEGARCGRDLAEKVRSLDSSRYVTQAVSGLLVGGPELFSRLGEELHGGDGSTDGGTGVNTAMTNLIDVLSDLMRSPVVAKKSAETMSYLDVAGYNYMEQRFALDRELFPERVVVASETHPVAIDSGWRAVTENPQVIGDFTWTGWDYLGEVGIGRTAYDAAAAAGGMASFHGDYPWVAAWCGDIDITGYRRPQSYYREIVFGLRSDPYIAVRRPEHHGTAAQSTPWSWSDSVSSWSWKAQQGAPVVVEVYADADEVELLVNGRSIGRLPAGASQRYRAEFDTVYEPGLLEAVARRDGKEIGRSALRSASGPVLLDVRADRAAIEAGPADLAFVSLTLVDETGNLHSAADRPVHIQLEGPGVLQGLASANPATEEPFTGSSCTTFDGRALAVVRPTGAGEITLIATSEGCERRISIDAKQAP